MIDTVGLSCEAGGLDVGDLERRGWNSRVTRSHKGGEVQERVKAFVTVDAVTVEYLASVGWLTARASLPKVLGKTNDVLLSWGDAVRALAVVTGDVAAGAVGDRLPALPEWGLWRFDPVWAWACDPGPYIDALRISRMPRTQAVCEAGSVRWRSLRSGAIFGRFYDKSREAGRPVELPARLERQVRPKRQVVRVDGDRVGGKVADLSEAVCIGAVKGLLRDFGLDRPIRSVSASRGALVGFYGSRKGSNLWRELLAFDKLGGWPADYSPGKVRRVERDCRRAGIRALSLDGELPALVM